MRPLTTLIASSLFVALLVIPTTVPSASSGIQQAVITTGVTPSARPETENLTVIDNEIGSVTFYTELIGFEGQTVIHQWLYNDKEVSSISLKISSGRSLNWSRSAISKDQLGRWEARILTEKGQILAARRFDVVDSGQSVGSIVEEQRIGGCAVKLADLQRRIEENPSVEYYQFLYEKQAERCK